MLDKYTLTIRSKRQPEDKRPSQEGADIFRGSAVGGGVEILLNGEPLRMVTNLALFFDAAHCVPIVCMVMVPQQLDIELTEADMRKAIGQKNGIMWDLADQVFPVGPRPDVPPPTPCFDDLSIEAMQRAYDANFPGAREAATKIEAPRN